MSKSAGVPDPRSQLGKRPGFSVPHIVVPNENYETPWTSESLEEPPKWPLKPAEAGYSVAGQGTKPTIRSLSDGHHGQGAIKLSSGSGLVESQKLLSHLLDRIDHRRPLPDVLGRAAGRNTAEPVKQRNILSPKRFGRSHAKTDSRDSNQDSDDDANLGAHADESSDTLDLVEQLRSLLILSGKQNLDIFDTTAPSTTNESPNVSKENVKRRGGRFSSIVSPISPSKPALDSPWEARSHRGTAPLSLRQRLMVTLASLLTTDCLHEYQHFSPLRPPSFIQTLSLDIATFLYFTGGLDAKLELIDLVIHGLYGVDAKHGRSICRWLEGRTEEILQQAKASPCVNERRNQGLGISSPEGGIDALSPEYGAPPSLGVSHERQSATSQYAFSLLGKLLSALMSFFCQNNSELTTLYRYHRLLSIIFVSRPQSATDLLEILAHGPEEARMCAAEILSTFYPCVTGHNVMSVSIAGHSYAGHQAALVQAARNGDDRYAHDGHKWVPWRSISGEETNIMAKTCIECGEEIHGFCLRCVLCDNLHHHHCHRHPSETLQYSVIESREGRTQQSRLTVKTSRVISGSEDALAAGSNDPSLTKPTEIRINEHKLHLVNLFELALCSICGSPLWGTHSQSYACTTGCQRLVHPECVSALKANSHIQCRAKRQVLVIQEGSLCIPEADFTESFEKHHEHLIRSEDALKLLTFDELAVLWGALWTTYHLTKNGLTIGSIRIQSMDSDEALDILPLRHTLRLYEKHLQLKRAKMSAVASRFVDAEGGQMSLDQSYLFDQGLLRFCTSILENTEDATHNPSDSGHLHSVTQLKKSLRLSMSIRDDKLAALYLDHLQASGYITCLLQKTSGSLESQACYLFAAPSIIQDDKASQLLIEAVESSLESVNLALNEVGMQMLVRRAWPSRLCSFAALTQLGHAVTAWIMNSDDCLHAVIRRFATRNRPLPGIQSASTNGSSVQTYTSTQETLLECYIRPWLKALHDLDPNSYTHMIYEEAQTILRAPNEVDDLDQTGLKILDRLTAVADAAVLFSVLSDIVMAWLDEFGVDFEEGVVIRSLSRLLRPDRPETRSALSNLWISASLLSAEDDERFLQVSRWMRVLSLSGVEIPWSTLRPLLSISPDIHEVEAHENLIVAVAENRAPVKGQDLANLASQVFIGYTNAYAANPSYRHRIIVQELFSLLFRVYHVDQTPGTIIEMPSMKDVRNGRAKPSRSRRHLAGDQTYKLESNLLPGFADLMQNETEAREATLHAVWTILSGIPAKSGMDEVLYDHCDVLYPSLFHLLGDQSNEVCVIRILLRIVRINPSKFEKFVVERLNSEDRLSTTEKILRFVLSLCNEELQREVKAARASVVGVINLFLEALLGPSSISAENLLIIESLLPPHWEAITFCFQEYLLQASDENRLSLLGKLMRYGRLIPHWQVLSWAIITNIMSEVQATFEAASHRTTVLTTGMVDPLIEARMVNINLAALALQMMAAGVPIDRNAEARLRPHLIASCTIHPQALKEASVIPLLPAMRCILDSTEYFEPDRAHGSSKDSYQAPIATPFLPVIIELTRQVDHCEDYLTQKLLLDIQMILVAKHSVAGIELSLLGALQSTAEVVCGTVSSENRLLALQILQIAVTRISKETIARVVPTLFSTVAKAFVKETVNDGDVAVIEQSRKFLQTAIQGYAKARLFVNLLKNDEQGGVSNSTSESPLPQAFALLDQELSDTDDPRSLESVLMNLADVFRRDRDTVGRVLGSLARITRIMGFIMSETATSAFGAFITRLARHVTDWTANEFDPNTILCTCADVLSHSEPEAAANFLHHISTLLHLCLARFEVTYATLNSLISVAETLKSATRNEDLLVRSVSEFTGSALHGMPVTMVTISTLLRILLDGLKSQKPSSASTESQKMLQDASSGCMDILRRKHATFSVTVSTPEVAVDLLLHGARILVLAERFSSGTLSSQLLNATDDVITGQMETIFYLLYALCEDHKGQRSGLLPAVYPVIDRIMARCLRMVGDCLMVQDTEGHGAEMMSLFFITFQVATLARHTGGQATINVSTASSLGTFWFGIWPDWNRLIHLSISPNCVNEPLRAVSQTTFAESVIFLGNLEVGLSSHHKGSIISGLHTLLSNRLKVNTSSMMKLEKAMMTIRGTGAHDRLAVGEVLASVRANREVTERIKKLRSRS